MGRHVVGLPPGFVLEDDLPQAGAAQTAPVGGVLPPGFVVEEGFPGPPTPTPQPQPDVSSQGFFSGLTRAMEQGPTIGLGEEVEAAGTTFARVTKNWVAGKSANWRREYKRAIGESRGRMEAFEEAHPKSALTAELTGAVASLPKLGATFVAKAPSLLGKAGRSALVGAPIGAAYGAGKAEGGPVERATGALMGGVIGAGLAPVATGAVAGIAKLVEVGARLIPNAAKREAAIEVAKALWRDNITVNQARIRLRQIGAHSILSDISENMRGLGGTVARMPGKARTAATRFLEQRQRHQHNRIAAYTRKALGAKGGYYKRMTDIMDARATAAQQLYDPAFQANQSMMTLGISRILETPAGRKALRVAATKIRNDRSLLSKLDPEMTAAAREAAQLGMMAPMKGGIGKGLKLRTLDYVKRALDDQIDVLRRAGRKDDARIVRNLKTDLLKELDAADATGLYAKARQTYAGHSESLEALEHGRKFIKGDVEVTAREIAEMTPADRTFFREGVNRHVTDIVKSKKEGADKAAMLLRVPGMREKMAATFETPRAYRQWLREMLGEEKMNKTFRELTGSATQQRLGAAEDLGTGALIRDIAWGAKGNPFAQMRLFGHAARGLKGPPREAVAGALSPMFSPSRPEQMGLLRAAKKLTPVAGLQMALPALAGQLTASQAYRRGLQESATLPLALLYEQMVKPSYGGPR